MEFVHERGIHRITSYTVNLDHLQTVVSEASRYHGARPRVLNYSTANFILTRIMERKTPGVIYGELLNSIPKVLPLIF